MEQQIFQDPNGRQVGGNHYAGDYQHWDLAEDGGIGALEYAATKYLCRFEKKNGLQDVEKAVHYIEKLILRVVQNGRRPRGACTREQLDRFFEAMGFFIPPRDERAAMHSLVRVSITLLCTWTEEEQLQNALQRVVRLLELLKEQAGRAKLDQLANDARG